MRLIDADAIQYDQLLNTGYKEHPLEWAVSRPLINSMPTIEAEPVKHGRWKFETAWQYKPCDGRGLERKAIFGTTKRTFNRLKCSGCKKVVVVDDTIHYAYCPHCGAKMDAEEAEP